MPKIKSEPMITLLAYDNLIFSHYPKEKIISHNLELCDWVYIHIESFVSDNLIMRHA